VHNITQTKFKLLVYVQSSCTKTIRHCNKYIKIQKQSFLAGLWFRLRGFKKWDFDSGPGLESRLRDSDSAPLVAATSTFTAVLNHYWNKWWNGSASSMFKWKTYVGTKVVAGHGCGGSHGMAVNKSRTQVVRQFGSVHAFSCNSPKVNKFGWNLEHSDYIVGAGLGRFWAQLAQ